MEILGIDVGGSAIKGAPVDTQTGRLVAERLRIPMPEMLKPNAMAEVIHQIQRSFNWTAPIGCGFPSEVRDGVILTAANIHKKWVGANAQQLFAEATGCPVLVLNDADAAGMAEMNLGAAASVMRFLSSCGGGERSNDRSAFLKAGQPRAGPDGGLLAVRPHACEGHLRADDLAEPVEVPARARRKIFPPPLQAGLQKKPPLPLRSWGE